MYTLHRFALLLLPLVLLAACAAPRTAGFCDYDVNDDGLYEDEFTTGVFDDFDDDDDGLLDRNEFDAGFGATTWDDDLGYDYARFDGDGDGLVNDAEFRTGFAGYDTFNRYDRDGDGLLRDDECI